jgi:ligand-binding SRPBCC domain-containing protein
MVEGDFKQLKHEHHFKSANNGTFLIDLFTFEIPYGVFGVLFTNLYLKKYLKRLLEQRNAVIKEYAESNKWKTILQQ